MHHKNTKEINIHTDTIIFLFEIAILRFFGGCTTIKKTFFKSPTDYTDCGAEWGEKPPPTNFTNFHEIESV